MRTGRKIRCFTNFPQCRRIHQNACLWSGRLRLGTRIEYCKFEIYISRNGVNMYLLNRLDIAVVLMLRIEFVDYMCFLQTLNRVSILVKVEEDTRFE